MRAKPGPVVKLWPSAHAIEREFAVMQALASTQVPGPQMLARFEDESIIGRVFYLMEFKEGCVLWGLSLPAMAATQRAAIYDAMKQVIAALHIVDIASVGLSSYGRPGNYLACQIARWSKQYVASVTTPIAEMDALMDWLPAHMPAKRLR
jgi:aminoglycoside phosphotransferase (APT) family kinase protein